MGSWGYGPFDNDDGADLVCDLQGGEGLALLRSVLEDVVAVPADAYLEAHLGLRAYASSAVLAGCIDRSQPFLDDRVTAWIDRVGLDPTSTDIELAAAAMRRILGANSELPSLFEGAGAPGGIAAIDQVAAAIRAGAR